MKLMRIDLDRAKPCTHRHVNGSWITWYDRTGTPAGERNGVSRRCLYCGEWQGLGPANDRIPPAELQLADALARVTVDELRDSLVDYWQTMDGIDRDRRRDRARRQQ